MSDEPITDAAAAEISAIAHDVVEVARGISQRTGRAPVVCVAAALAAVNGLVLSAVPDHDATLIAATLAETMSDAGLK